MSLRKDVQHGSGAWLLAMAILPACGGGSVPSQDTMTYPVAIRADADPTAAATGGLAVAAMPGAHHPEPPGPPTLATVAIDEATLAVLAVGFRLPPPRPQSANHCTHAEKPLGHPFPPGVTPPAACGCETPPPPPRRLERDDFAAWIDGPFMLDLLSSDTPAPLTAVALDNSDGMMATIVPVTGAAGPSLVVGGTWQSATTTIVFRLAVDLPHPLDVPLWPGAYASELTAQVPLVAMLEHVDLATCLEEAVVTDGVAIVSDPRGCDLDRGLRHLGMPMPQRPRNGAPMPSTRVP